MSLHYLVLFFQKNEPNKSHRQQQITRRPTQNLSGSSLKRTRMH